ncbi:MAG: purine-nucleoside phosphorylase [Pseudomonadota bacterium]
MRAAGSDDLFRAALAVRDHAHAPYSGFHVGCAIRAEDGRIFAGANVENAAYPQSQCAEANTIGIMVAAGAKRIVEALVVADSPTLVSPCGGCRQRLAEFAAGGTPIHIAGIEGVRRTVSVGELLPLGFGPANLGVETDAAPDAVDRLREVPGAAEARIAVVLGSGLGGLVDALSDVASVDYTELPGFPQPSVEGHAGCIVSGHLGGVPVLCLQGRVHLYEGGPASAVNPPIRCLKALGIRLLVLTNAAGAITPTLRAGDVALITDHINALGTNPLIGPNEEDVGPRFLDLSEVYDAALRQRVVAVAAREGMALGEGVYLATLGPVFETPAEVRAFRAIGADLVGMSTVPEAISARHAGLRVLGFSAVTNAAAGLGGGALSHEETLRVGAAAGAKLADLLRHALPELHHAL